jgi:hypothetical protein
MGIMQGLQVFDVNGRCTLDVTDRLTRVLGTINTGYASSVSHIDNNLLNNGTPWFYCYFPNDPNWWRVMSLNVAISGNTLSWQWAKLHYSSYTYQDTITGCSILYGVY